MELALSIHNLCNRLLSTVITQSRLRIRHVAEFAQHFDRSPDQLGAEDIRQFWRLELGRRIHSMSVPDHPTRAIQAADHLI
jgi:hypothetical protein